MGQTRQALGAVCGSVHITAPPGAPPAPNGAATVTANATCSAGAIPEFQFSWTADGNSTLHAASGWQTQPTLDWSTQGLPSGRYRMFVYARALGNQSTYDSTDYVYLDVGDTCYAVGLQAAPLSSPVGPNVALTAAATCTGAAQPEFRFQMQPIGASSTTVLRDWGPATYSWPTAGRTSGRYNLTVWTRGVGNPSKVEAVATLTYVLGETCNSVTLAPVNISPPPALPRDIPLSASATCTSGSPEYRFSYIERAGGPEVVIRDWSPLPTTTWHADVHSGLYSISAYARRQGNTNSVWDAVSSTSQLLGRVCDQATLNVPSSTFTVGSSVPLSAASTCTGGTPVYRFRYRALTSLSAPVLSIQDWGSANAQWDTANLAPGSYQIIVNARNGENSPNDESKAVRTVALQAAVGSCCTLACDGVCCMTGTVCGASEVCAPATCQTPCGSGANCSSGACALLQQCCLPPPDDCPSPVGGFFLAGPTSDDPLTSTTVATDVHIVSWDDVRCSYAGVRRTTDFQGVIIDDSPYSFVCPHMPKGEDYTCDLPVNAPYVARHLRCSATGSCSAELPLLQEPSPSLQWRPLGPAPLTGNTGVLATPLEFGTDSAGRINRISVDPNTGAIYVATSNGGVFRTLNPDSVKASPPSRVHWEPLTDALDSLSTTTMAMNASSAPNLIIGTGNSCSSAISGFEGLVYVSSVQADGSFTWTRASDPAGLLRDSALSGLWIQGTNALATTENHGGVFKSVDGGFSWTSAVGGQLPAELGSVQDLVVDPTDATRHYLAVIDKDGASGGVGVYRGDMTGSSWTRVSDQDMSLALPQALTNNPFFAHLAVSADGTLFVAVNSQTYPPYVGFATGQGQSWYQLEVPRLLPLDGDNVRHGIIKVSTLATSEVLIETGDAHLLNTAPAIDFIRLTGITGLPANAPPLNGDWKWSPFTDPATGAPSDKKFLLRSIGSTTSFISPVSFAVQQASAAVQRWRTVEPYSVAADPFDSKFVYIAGVEGDSVLRGYTAAFNDPAKQQNAIPSQQWTSLSASSFHPHDDVQRLTFDRHADLLVGGDGGVLLRTHPSGEGTWYNLNGDLSNIEFTAIAFDPLSHALFGGTQDNGTVGEVHASAGAASTAPWNEIRSGDGADVKAVRATDLQPSDPPKAYRYMCDNGCRSLARATYDAGGAQIGSEENVALLVNPPQTMNGKPQTYSDADSGGFARLGVSAQNSNRLVVTGALGIWESVDSGGHVSLVPGSPTNATSVAFSHPLNPDVLWATNESGVYTRFAAANPMIQTCFPGPDPALSVVMSPSDFNTAYVTSEHDVFVTRDGGTAWTSLTGDLAQVQSLAGQGPGHLLSIVYIHGARGDRLAVAAGWHVGPAGCRERGTRAATGVFTMALSSPGVWKRLGSNLPNAVPSDLDYDTARDVLAVATQGRGVWTVTGLGAADPRSAP